MNPKTILAPKASVLPQWRSYLQLLMTLAMLACGVRGYAQGFQTDNWTGLGPDNNWFDFTNWNHAVTLNGDDLIFSGTTRLTPANNFTNLHISSITISSPQFTLSGSALTITNGFTDSSAPGSNTVSIPLTIGASQSFVNNSSGTDTISGTIALNASTLTFGGSGTFFVSGVVSSTNGGSVAVNAGVTRLSSTAAWGTNVLDSVKINGGTLQLGSSGAIPGGAGFGNTLVNGTLDLNGNSPTLGGLEGGGVVDSVFATGISTLTVGAGNTNDEFDGIIRNTAGTVALVKTGYGNETINGANTYGGSTLVQQGTLTVGPLGQIGINSKAMVISPGAVLDVSALGPNGYNPLTVFNLNAGTPMKPFTNFLGSYSTNYAAFVITTNVVATTNVFTTNSIISVVNADLNGSFTLSGGSFTPEAPAPGYATFTVNGNLNLDNGNNLGANSLNFLLNSVTNAGGGLNDLIVVTNGSLNIGDLVNIVIQPANGTLATGQYTLIESTNYIAGSDNINNSAPPTYTVIAPRGISGTIDTTSQPGNVLLTASGTAVPAAIVWAGTAAINNWDIDVSQDWKKSGSPDYFFSQDNVTFDDTGFGTINLPGPVTPNSTTFNNNLTNYTFNANSGSFIAGTGGLTVSGTGTVSLNNPNSYTGNTTINNAGTLIMGSYGGYLDTIIYSGVAPGQLIFGSGNGSFLNNEIPINTSQATALAGLTLNSGANATVGTVGTLGSRGANNVGYIAFGPNINRSVGSSVFINFTIKGGTANNGVYFTNTIPWTNGLILNAGWIHTGTDWLAAQTNLFNGNNPASGLYNYTGYSNNTALATWVSTNNMSLTTSTFADTASATVNSLKLQGPATINISSGQTLTLQNGGLLVSSAGTGPSAIVGGTLEGAAGADLIVLQNLTTQPFTIGSVIADNGSATALTLGGLGGTLILTNNNTYTGATYINAGSLQVGAGTALGSIASSSAILDNGSLSFNRPDNTSVGGVVSGLGGITQLGLGTLSLTANNTFLGKLSINSGTVQLGAGGAGGSISNAVSVLDNGALVFNNSGTVSYPKIISGYGQLVQFGSGTLVIATNEAYTGPTTISNGIVLLTASGSISNTASIAISAGATLDASAVSGGLTLRGAAPGESLAGQGSINGSLNTAAGTTIFPGGNGVIGTLTVNNNLSLNGGNYVFDLSNTSHDQITVGGTLAQTGGTILVEVTGSPLANGLYPLILATGGVSGAAGNIALANFSQAGQIAILTNSTPNELDLLVISGTAPNDFWLGDNSQNLWDTTASSFWLNSLGASTLYANGDAVFFNDTGSVSPAVNIDAVIHPSAITVNSTNDNYTLGLSTANGRITGGASLVKNGPGTLVLQTVNDYLSGTIINGGVVQLNGSGVSTADGMVGVGPVVNNGTLIANNVNTETLAGNLSGNGLLVQQGAGMLILSGNNSAYTGPITFNNLLQVGNGGASGSLGTGNVTNNGGLLFNLAIPNGTTANANISGTGSITNVGTGTTTLNGNNTYAGSTVVNQGTLRAGSATAIPPTSTLVLNDGTAPVGTFDLDGQNVTVTGLVGNNAGNGTATLSTSTIINNGGGIATLTISGNTTNTFNGQIVDSTTGGGQTALAVINGANESLFVLTNSSGPNFPFPNTFSGGITISNATLSVGAVLAATPGNEGTAALGGNPLGTQNILMTGTNANLYTGAATGSTGPTITTSVGTINVPSGATAWIFGPQRGTFIATALTGAGTVIYQPNYVRSQCNLPGSAFTGTIIFEQIQNTSGGNLPLNSAVGYPLANVVFGVTNRSTVDFCGTVSGNVLPFGSLSGGDNTFVVGGGTTPASEGSAPTIYAIGALNTSSTVGAQFIDAGCGIRKVGTGTLTFTNAVLSYGGQTVVSNGVLAFVPLVAAPATTAAASTFLVGSNFTVVSPGILNVSGMGGSLLLGHSTVQSLYGNGTLNGNLTATSAYIAPGKRASQAGFFTGSGLQVSGAVTMTAATTNFITINRTNTVPNDSLTAASIAYAGVLIVTNVGDTAYPPASTNVFHLFNGTISGTFASITLPTLPANEFWITNLSAGTISLVNTSSGLATNPTNITVSVSGNILSLSWPADHLGWTLQAQTNSLLTGLGTHWVDVAGSASSTSSTITIDPTQPTVFYRLSQQP